MPTSDSVPEGYATLVALEQGAPNYNAWLGRRFRPYLGQRVLEVGAGIGTITRQILQGRELVVALEAEATYSNELLSAFKHEMRVKVMHCPVEETNWDALSAYNFDSALLSNVLEHIRDDSAAIRNIRRALTPGCRLVVLVPALTFLFGTLDEAVGHRRRYMPSTLRKVIGENGFELTQLTWMNLLGIPGWFLNGRVLGRRVLPQGQLRAYDHVRAAAGEGGVSLSPPGGAESACGRNRSLRSSR